MKKFFKMVREIVHPSKVTWASGKKVWIMGLQAIGFSVGSGLLITGFDTLLRLILK